MVFFFYSSPEDMMFFYQFEREAEGEKHWCERDWFYREKGGRVGGREQGRERKQNIHVREKRAPTGDQNHNPHEQTEYTSILKPQSKYPLSVTSFPLRSNQDPIFVLYINRSIKHIFFCVWPFLFNIRFLRSSKILHVVIALAILLFSLVT